MKKLRAPFSKNEEWLLKSSGRILGPFMTSEVVNGIQSRRFGLMNEICKNSGRWRLIRDESTFLEAVKSIRNLTEEGGEKTSTSSVTFQTLSDFKLANTVSMTPNSEDTLTPVPPSLLNIDKGFKKINAKERDLGPDDSPSEYGSVKDVRFRNKIKRQNKKSWLLVAFFGLVVLVGAAYYFLQASKRKNSQEVFQEYLNRGLIAKSQGLNRKALELLTRAKQLGSNDIKVELELATLQIALENQTILGRREIEKLLLDNQNLNLGMDNADFLAKGYSAIGLSYLLESDSKNAFDNFEKAKSYNSKFLPPQVNQAVIYFRDRSYNLAENAFSKVLENNQNDGYLIIGSAISAFEAMKNFTVPLRNYPLVTDLINNYLKENSELNQELYLLLSYSLLKQGLKEEASVAIRKTLSIDSESSSSYNYDLLINRSLVSWKVLMTYCSSISTELPKSVEAKALLAFCYFKAGREEEAKTTILQADSQGPKNPIVQLSRAILLKSFGQEGESNAALMLALNDESLLASYSLKAQTCVNNGDLSCAEKFWRKLLEVEPRSVQAYSGLAAISLKKKNKLLAQEYINKGQAISRTYLPLWELRNQL